MISGMRKSLKYIRFILMGVFTLLMTVQTVLGIGWMVVNIGHLPLFEETFLLAEASQSLVLDEYMGVLYPLLIRLARGITTVIPIPYYVLLYVLQLAAAGYTANYLLKYNGWILENDNLNRIRKILVIGYLLTFPQLLQLHLTVLPYSLSMSVGILLICDGLYYLRHADEIRGKVLIRLCGLWMLEVLLLPDYIWLAGVFLSGVLVAAAWKNKQWRGRILVSILCTVLCFGVIESSTQTPGSMGRIQKSAGAALLRRFVWPDFVTYSFFWPEEVRETFDIEALTGVAKYAEETVYHFGYTLDEKYGRKAANDIYREMVKVAFGLDTKLLLKEVGRDYVAYLCPQVSFQQQMSDNHGALLAWNYGRLQEHAPILTKYYVRCSFTGWNVMCMPGLLLLIAAVLRKRIRLSWGTVLLGMSALFMAFWYTMQGAGIQDYKNVMLISFLWLLSVVWGFFSVAEKTDENK